MVPGSLAPDTELTRAVRQFADGPDDNARIANLAALAGEDVLPTREAVMGTVTALRTRAAAMKPYVGQFPLPPRTSTSILALITPQDVVLLADTLKLLADDTEDHHFSTALESHGVTVEGTTRPATPGCFSYDLTFTRTTFHAGIKASACRQGTAWAISSPRAQKERTP